MKGLEETATKQKQDIKHLRTKKSIPGKKTWEETCNSFVWKIYKGKCDIDNKGKQKLYSQVQIPTKYSGKEHV